MSSTRPVTPASSRGRLRGTGTGAVTPGSKRSTGVATTATTATASKSSSSTLNPSLPRMPSFPSINSRNSRSVPSSPAKKHHKYREPRCSSDERDPSTANSTEDEMDLEDDYTNDMSMMSAKAPSSSVRPRSKSTVATRPSSVGPDQQQNICVCVRIRPSAPGAAEDTAPIWELDPSAGKITLSENHPIIEKRKNGVSEEAYSYRFDSLLLPPDVTEKLYTERISPVVRSAMEGFNATVFSFGQTGSGKTHTILGNDDEPGIIPQAVQEIFSYIEEGDPTREFLLRVSYLEIYNENLRDLLLPRSASTKATPLNMREEKGRIVTDGLLEEIVTDSRGVFECLMRGEENRSVAGTDWNHRSSRSHCVFSMIIESRPRASILDITLPSSSSTSTELAYAASSPPSPSPPLPSPSSTTKGEVRVSQLNLIDLAGSERATSQEERRKEGAFINKSLLSLGNVIQKLAEGKKGQHIGYRDSKLTRLLQTSLSGNARIAIVCTVSPEARHGVESVSTLKFASRAMKVITRAERGVIQDEQGALMAKYEKELIDLRARLAEKDAQQLENASNVSGTMMTPDPSNSGIGEEVLDEERQKRQRAETQAEDYRLECLRLKDQITHLSSQIVSSHSMLPSSSSSHSLNQYTPAAERHYGEIGVGGASGAGGGRPAGPRGKRRISELAFGIGQATPLSKLRAMGSSVRSFSSNLETVKSPSMMSLSGTGGNCEEHDETIRTLQKELEDLKDNQHKEQEASEERMKDLQERIETLQSELIHVASKMEQAISEKDLYIQEAGEQATANMLLQRELDSANARSSETSFGQHEESARLQAELEEVRMQMRVKDGRIQDLEMKMREENAGHASHTFRLESDMGNVNGRLDKAEKELKERTKDVKTLKEQLKQADEAFDNLEKQQNASATSSLSTRKQLADAESRIAILEKDATISAASASAARKQLTETESRLSSSEQQQRHKEQEYVFALQELQDQAARDHSKLQRKSELAVSALSSDLSNAKSTINTQAATIADLKEELEKKQAAKSRSDAAIKAANMPPDFGALQAKLAAVSGRSALSASGGRNSLNSSLNGHQQASEQQVDSLKAELGSVRKEAKEAERTIEEQKEYIGDLESRIKTWKHQIVMQSKLIEELQEGSSSSAAAERLPGELDNLSIGNQQSAHSAPPRSPFGAISGHHQPPPQHQKSASLNYGSYLKSSSSISRPSTPKKKDKHGFNSLFATPEPLPTPPGMGESRKNRRTTIENELSLLRESGKAERSRSILLSPRAERTRQSEHHNQRSRTLSNVDELESSRYSMSRSKKGSAESYTSSGY